MDLVASHSGDTALAVVGSLKDVLSFADHDNICAFEGSTTIWQVHVATLE